MRSTDQAFARLLSALPMIRTCKQSLGYYRREKRRGDERRGEERKGEKDREGKKRR